MANSQDRIKMIKTAVLGAVGSLALVLAVMLALTGMLPVRYLVLAWALLAAAVGLVIFLTWDPEKRRRFRAGSITGALLAGLLLVGVVAAGRALAVLNNVTTPGTEMTDIGIYVRREDPAEELGDMTGYTYGILEALERENVDRTVADLEDRLGHKLTLREFGTPVQLAEALFGGQVDAIICSVLYLELLADTEDYGDVMDRVREITRLTVELAQREPDNSQQGDGPEGLMPFTVYISGIDSQHGLSTRSRSDVNIIAAVNPQTRQVLLVFTPRDYYVPLSISDGAKDKLTHAGIYGVQVCMDTLEMLYGIELDYYFQLDFSGFENIVDSLGGITVYSPYDFIPLHGEGYHVEQGENQMNGKQALAFVRERYAFKDGDFQRGRNLMEVIKAVMRKAQSAEVLTNYLSLMDAVEGSFEMSVPYDQIAELVKDQLDNGGGWDVQTYSVSGSNGSEIPWSLGSKQYVMIPDQTTVDAAKRLIEQVQSGETVKIP